MATIRVTSRCGDWRSITGVIINPFSKQFKIYWEQIMQIAVLNYQQKIGVGMGGIGFF